MAKNKANLKLVALVLLVCSALFLLYVIFRNGSVIMQPYDPKVFKDKFEASQWRVPNSKYPISDTDLYAYSGYELVHGTNPILVSPEVPTLGKYMIGLSIVLTGNHQLISLFLALLSLWLIFYFLHLLTGSYLASAIGVFLTSINTIFYDQIIHAPQLDIFQVFFLLLILIFYTLFERKNRLIWLVLAGIAVGCFISIKVAFLSFLLINAWLTIYLILRRKSLITMAKELIIANVVALITYTVTYLSYFLQGGSIMSFLGVQKWIFTVYSSSLIDTSKLIGNYLNLIFFNKWRFWSEGYPVLHYSAWSILWPVIFIIGMYVAIRALLDKKTGQDQSYVLLISFVLVYNVFLFIVPVFPRYLILLFVPLNLLIALHFAPIITSKLYGKK